MKLNLLVLAVGSALFEEGASLSASNSLRSSIASSIKRTGTGYSSSHGQQQYCKNNEAVTGHCTSGTYKDCKSNTASGIFCGEADFLLPETSHWLSAKSFGAIVSCDKDEIATGTCSSGAYTDCNDKSAQLQCTKMAHGKTLDARTEKRVCCGYGVDCKCPTGTYVGQFCGAGRSGDCDVGGCGAKTFTRLACYQIKDQRKLVTLTYHYTMVSQGSIVTQKSSSSETTKEYFHEVVRFSGWTFEASATAGGSSPGGLTGQLKLALKYEDTKTETTRTLRKAFQAASESTHKTVEFTAEQIERCQNMGAKLMYLSEHITVQDLNDRNAPVMQSVTEEPSRIVCIKPGVSPSCTPEDFIEETQACATIA